MNGKLRRHFITGEWEEVPFEGGQTICYEGESDTKASTLVTSTRRPLVSDTMAVHPDQAKTFNQSAARGVNYLLDGRMVASSREAARREAKRRDMYYNS